MFENIAKIITEEILHSGGVLNALARKMAETEEDVNYFRIEIEDGLYTEISRRINWANIMKELKPVYFDENSCDYFEDE